MFPFQLPIEQKKSWNWKSPVNPEVACDIPDCGDDDIDAKWDTIAGIDCLNKTTREKMFEPRAYYDFPAEIIKNNHGLPGATVYAIKPL